MPPKLCALPTDRSHVSTASREVHCPCARPGLLHASCTPSSPSSLPCAVRSALDIYLEGPVARCIGIGGLPVPSDESVIPATHCPQRPPSSGHHPAATVHIQRPCMFVQRGRNHNPAAPCIRSSSQGMASRRVAPSRGVFPRPSPSASLAAFTCIRGSSPPIIIHAPTPTLVPVPVGARLILIL